MSFSSLTSDYEVISNAEVSSILDKYTPEMIISSIYEIIKIKSNKYHILPLANMVKSIEDNIIKDINIIPDRSNILLEKRVEIYNIITTNICNYHNLNFQLNNNIDIYTISYYLYEFLVSKYYEYCITFFSNFLIRESNNIVKLIDDNFDNQKLNKKRYNGKNINIGIIHSNLNIVLDMISSLDITLYNILDIVFPTEVSEFIKEVITDNGDFYKNFYVKTISGEGRPESITNIRFKLLPPQQGNNIINDYII